MHYANLIQKKYSKANMNQSGTGVAGGLVFAFLSYTNAVLEYGIKILTILKKNYIVFMKLQYNTNFNIIILMIIVLGIKY